MSLYHYILIPLMMLNSGPIPKIKKKINHTAGTVKRVLHLDTTLAAVKDSLIGLQSGKISYYGKRHNGRKTASGEVYDMNEFTASHKNFPFGTKVKVTNLANNKSVILKINDRLPKSSKRMIDVSYQAAKELGMIGRGLAKGAIVVLEWGKSLKKEIVLPHPETDLVEKPENLKIIKEEIVSADGK
ncbi:MAG: septal ring lytic transglycosylase RlpA family protein [Acidobacteriota bacterium]